MSRLTIDITEQQHQALKATAALQGKTIKQYTLERLFPDVVEEDNALYELKNLLNQRLIEARRGGLAQGSISDMADDILKEKNN